MRLRGWTSFAGCSIRVMPCTSMTLDGTEILEDAKVKGKAGASRSNQGASHRNKNRLASRRRRGMRIREGETRQNTRRKEGRPGLLFWMDGWDLRTCGRVDGWSHEPPPAPGEALCCCQGSTAENFLFFFFASHECARGGQQRYVGVKQGDGERVNERSRVLGSKVSQVSSSATPVWYQ